MGGHANGDLRRSGPSDRRESHDIAWHARLNADGFGAAVSAKTNHTTAPTTQLVAGSGFFLVQWGDHTIQYDSLGSSEFFTLYSPDFLGSTDMLPDPQGQYVAAALGGQLQLVTTLDPDAHIGTSTLATTPPCDSILSWAAHKERLACYYGLPNGGASADATLAVYDVAGDTVSSLTVPTFAGVHIPYGATDSHRAQLSANGGYLAMTTDSSLYLATLGNGSQRVTLQAPLKPAGFTELAFSPDENALLVQVGNTLSVTTSNGAVSSPLPLTTSAASFTPCRSLFLPTQDQGTATVPVAPWCGSSDVTMDARWSSDSQAVATHTSAGITTWALTKLAQAVTDDGTVVCASCTGQFSFQP